MKPTITIEASPELEEMTERVLKRFEEITAALKQVEKKCDEVIGALKREEAARNNPISVTVEAPTWHEWEPPYAREQEGIKNRSDLMMHPQNGETVPEGFTCENCLARDFFAEVFDAVIDWQECTDCAYAEERRKE